jgi:hypothetical protein
MNKWRIAGVIVLALVAGALVLRSCTPDKPAPTAPVLPPRETFHASKPVQVDVVPTPGANTHEWLARELRFVLGRGKMRVASRGTADLKTFVLRIELPGEKPTTATLSLIAPDGQVERQLDVPVSSEDRLATVQSLARKLPAFLGAATTATDWSVFPGTTESAAYEGFLQASSALLDSKAKGFTQPQHSRELSRSIEQLEALTRKYSQFARAQGLLAIAYLGLGGSDQPSLTQIADSTAKRALTLDDALADAHGAMGLARLRRGEWIAARERFDAALEIDANSIPALEGLACLLTEVGHSAAALPIAKHAVAMQAGNVGAHECLAYAQIAAGPGAEPRDIPSEMSKELAVAQVAALSAMLSGDTASAEHTLANATGAADWVKPLTQAVNNKKAIPEALRAITRAAGDGEIDATTEVMAGAALRQPDFVFNRMTRLEKQSQAVPLQLLWLPQTDFLRRNRRFEQLVTAVDLASYWQENGRPEICEKEPQIYGCSLRPSAAKAAAKQKSAER